MIIFFIFLMGNGCMIIDDGRLVVIGKKTTNVAEKAKKKMRGKTRTRVGSERSRMSELKLGSESES